MSTPTTPEGLIKYDHLPPEEAIKKAWLDPGANPSHHRRMQIELLGSMPLLGRAIIRLVQEERQRDLTREFIENETHIFKPYNAGWHKPRCKVCQEFEDHPIHV